MSRFFYHGIRNCQLAPDTIIDIFKSGGIKSKRRQNRSYRIGFNGPDYISICRKCADEEYETDRNNAFQHYILNSFCFIIRDDIDAIPGVYTPDVINWNRFELVRFMNEHPEIRITDMFDEWQVRDEIGFSHIIGLGIPIDWVKIMHQKGYEDVLPLTEQIILLATSLGLDIVNSSAPDFIEQYEKSKESDANIEFKLII